MITAYLYNCADDPRTVNKTLSVARTVEMIMLETSSILTPRLRITWTDSLTGYNYMYIPAFNRYYFITDISAEPAGQGIINATVDVLMSYAAAIKQCPAVVVRYSRREQRGSAKSTYMNDSQLPISNGRSIRAVEFEGTDLNIDVASMTTNNFVLNVAGGGAITENEQGG